MKRIVWLKVGDTRLHLVKLAGSFLVVTFMLKVMQAAYNVFLTADKIQAAEMNGNLATTFFGWTMSSGQNIIQMLNCAGPICPLPLSLQDKIGIMLAPTADFLLWIGLLVISIMLYQAGKVMFPIEEYETTLPEHHRAAIVEAVRAHRAKLAREMAAKKQRR